MVTPSLALHRKAGHLTLGTHTSLPSAREIHVGRLHTHTPARTGAAGVEARRSASEAQCAVDDTLELRGVHPRATSQLRRV